MRFRSAQIAAAALAACAALSGCGKTLSGQAGGQTPGATPGVGTGGSVGIATSNTTRVGGSDSTSDAAGIALAVYPGLTPATRPQAVVLVNGEDWPAALATSVFAASPLGAPLLYSGAGETLPLTSAQALEALKPTGARALGGTQLLRIGAGGAPSGYKASSITGASPAALAAAVERIWSGVQGHTPRQVIVTAADGPPAMAMPAAGLAAQSGAPILFVERSAVPEATAGLLSRLARPSIYIAGPRSLIGERVARALGRYGQVTRIAGSTPTTNAVAVARFSDGSFGWGVIEPGHGFVFANAARPLDAPAAAILSASGDFSPLLLLENPNGLPPVLSGYLSDLQPGTPTSGPVHTVYNRGWLIGDETAISATTQAQLDSLLEVSSRPTSEPAIATPTTPANEPATTANEPTP
jgi:hypothetical protein